MPLAHTLTGSGSTKILFLHDWLGDSRNYDAAFRYLDTAAFTCARVDFPGYGASKSLPLGQPLEAQVLVVADALKWPRFHLVAHSMSTVVAQRLLRTNADRLQSVTLTCPVSPGTELPDEVIGFLRDMGLHPEKRRDPIVAQRNPNLSVRWAELKVEDWNDSATPQAVAELVPLFTRPNLPVTTQPAKTPIQVITGDLDGPPFRRDAVEPPLKTVHPHATFQALPLVGHYPMLEMPPLFMSLVETFAAKAG